MGWDGAMKEYKYYDRKIVWKNTWKEKTVMQFNKKKYLDDYHKNHWEVLCSAIVNNVYYASCIDKSGKTYGGQVFAVIEPVWTDRHSVYKKVMSEFSHPFCYNCPKKILDMLPLTDSKDALSWRAICYKKFKNKPKYIEDFLEENEQYIEENFGRFLK
ncbi:hypothetical protein K5E_11110 [Enterococcus thailandicus]|uniref:hypothetical protein n=1 Tax=Enterococcus thailandicus TaxID=417368 RepID=UPI00244D8739|nr:hypothetical protein [Enterococcus thailandicus]GMC02591.1 hypothetical protein K4E_01010 [Enterococcus thailandicus]GMC08972.1 hypothetical protein K5E_11110 [Enterococcus thailandicus]